jgi:hypothetical protein
VSLETMATRVEQPVLDQSIEAAERCLQPDYRTIRGRSHAIAVDVVGPFQRSRSRRTLWVIKPQALKGLLDHI